MSKYIDAEKLIAEIERRKKQDVTFRERSILIDIETAITSLQHEQPDNCIFGNTPSESYCKFCGVECALREPKQTGTTSAGLSSKDEAIGLAIMAYLDTKVKHDNAKVCGVSLKVAREWIREKIANKQEQPEVEWKEGFHSHSIKARVYPCLDRNTVRVESDERLEKNEYLYPGRNVRMVILLDNKDNTLNARKEETK